MTLDDRLDNWSRAWRWRQSQGQALFFEGRSRSTRGQEKEYETGEWIGDGVPRTDDVHMIDPVDAGVVENAVCCLDLYHHVILKGYYIRRWPDHMTINKAREAVGEKRTRRIDMLSSLAMSKALLVAQLELPAVMRKERARERVRTILGLEPLVFGIAA